MTNDNWPGDVSEAEGTEDNPADTSPRISIVVPAYNEEAILDRSLRALIARLDALLEDRYEVLLCENGSTDRTPEIAAELSQAFPQVRVEALPLASYGLAIRHGISHAQGRDVVIFNVDFWNVAFLQKAIGYLTYYDVVVGSKAVKGAKDMRPLPRLLATRGLNFVLRLVCGFQGTDTHGIKAFNRSRILPIVAQCRLKSDLFDTELVLRAQRAGLRYREIPVSVRERRPARSSFLKRIPKAMVEVAVLARTLGRTPAPTEETLEDEGV